MKSLCTILMYIFCCTITKAQFGLRVGYSTSSSLLADMNWRVNKNVLHLGGTYQFNGQLGGAKNTQLANYGRTSLGGDAYLILLDFGYSRWLTNHLALGAEVSLGANRFFTNYSDRRFKSGGYHLITGSEFQAGVGLKGTYCFNSGFGFFVGYNMLSGANAGICYMSKGN